MNLRKDKMAKEQKTKEQKIGQVSHYYNKISVGIIKLTDTLKVGDEIHIKGHTTDLTQKVESIEVNHQSVDEAKKGDVIGVKVSDHVREDDEVFKSVEKS